MSALFRKVIGMNDLQDELQREYVEVLDELDRIAAQRPGTWLAPRPVRWAGEGVQIDATLQARAAWAGVGARRASAGLEEQYRVAGGDVEDLHRLVLARESA